MNKDKDGELKPGLGTGVIVKKDNKVLYGKRLKKMGQNTWHFPGGSIEAFESIKDCAIRETKEETNVDIKNLKIITITEDIHQADHDHYITIWLVADYVGGEVTDMEPDKAQDWDWYEWDKLPKPFFLPVENFMKLGINPFDDENK